MSKYTIKCLGCIPVTNVEEFARTLFVTNFCKVLLRVDDQRPGRAIIVPFKHIHSDELLNDENKEILDDIYVCKKILTNIYKEEFGMTRVNWAQLGNLDKDENGNSTSNVKYSHGHYHFFPTYEEEVVILNQVFIDDKFGEALNMDPKCRYKKWVPPIEILSEIKKRIQQKGHELKLLEKPTSPNQPFKIKTQQSHHNTTKINKTKISVISFSILFIATLFVKFH